MRTALHSLTEVGSKAGTSSLLAVATEQGTLHILDTSRRKDWDAGMNLNLPLPLIFVTNQTFRTSKNHVPTT